MDNERLKNYLIGGALMTLLREADRRTLRAWIIQVPQGATRITYDPPTQSGDFIVGGDVIPAGVLQQGRLVKPTREIVLGYLQESLGLTRRQAKEVHHMVCARQLASLPRLVPVRPRPVAEVNLMPAHAFI